MDTAQARVRAIVSGTVQGVGYRAFTVRQAHKLGLYGWVRNRPDGTVEVEAQGSRGRLDDLLAALRRGPAYARVRDLQVSWHQPHPEAMGFSVRW